MNQSQSPLPMDRRDAIKWMLAAAASLTARLHAQAPGPAGGTKGYGPDPDLMRVYKPGDLWPLVLDAGQRRQIVALCDEILPADAGSPAASSVGVPDFLNEWVSAPYADQAADRELFVAGLAAVDEVAHAMFRRGFAEASAAERSALCRQMSEASPDLPAPANDFFKRFRDLAMLGFYTTPVGSRDVGYVGNTPTVTFDGPPPEVLRRLSLS
jgi:hypothetical protein